MSTIRKQSNKWNAIVRVQGHPYISKTFVSKTDATRWANLTEVKLRREDAGISKMKFPKFEDVARRYIVKSNLHFVTRHLPLASCSQIPKYVKSIL